MNPRSGIGSKIKQSLLRGIALLFLFYTGVDLALTDYHRNETLDLSRTIISADSHDDRLAIAASPANPENLPSDREAPRDEDCFCCCAHVLPSPVFVDSDNAELTQLRTVPIRTALPTAPSHSLYRPPRSA